MGSWISNMHIRKNGKLQLNQITECLKSRFEESGFETVDAAEEADCGLAVVESESSDWYSVYSDCFSFEDPAVFKNTAAPCSEALGADVLGIACLDSDYLYLNLINPSRALDAWICVGSGSEYGIKRRRVPGGWKNEVDNYTKFKGAVSPKYICAEEVLYEIEECLKLPAAYSNMEYDELEDVGADAVMLHFRMPSGDRAEPPRLKYYINSLTPCEMGRPSAVSCLNTGGASRGLSVYFTGDYVEDDEITFENVELLTGKDMKKIKRNPISLEKIRLPDGKWAYYYHDPNMRIPEKVDERLGAKKQADIKSDRHIFVRFTPRGNPRKRLDIAVTFVPDKNPAGQTSWFVWQFHGSKEKYLEYYNKDWADRHPEMFIPMDSVDL